MIPAVSAVSDRRRTPAPVDVQNGTSYGSARTPLESQCPITGRRSIESVPPIVGWVGRSISGHVKFTYQGYRQVPG